METTSSPPQGQTREPHVIHGGNLLRAKLPGVNHLFVPAMTGEVEEYGALRDRRITPDLPSAIVDWLQTLVVK